jgi:hypothetical protein
MDHRDALPDEWGREAEGPGRHQSVAAQRSLGESDAWGAARLDAAAGVEHLAQAAVGVGKLAAPAQDALARDDLRWGDSRSAGHWRAELCRPAADPSAARSYVGREPLDVAALPEVFAQEPAGRLPVVH